MPHTDPSTLMIHGVPEQIMPGALHPQWVEAARAKGFELVARVRNRYNLALRCKTCGELVRKAVYVLMTSDRPLCAHCLENAWAKTAEAAGLRLLRRDPGTTQYAFYLAPCGHEIRRQFEFVRRIARGEVKHRCEICHAAREAAEAAARDWELMSADPEGDRGYRLYPPHRRIQVAEKALA